MKLTSWSKPIVKSSEFNTWPRHFPFLYGNWEYISVFTGSRHPNLLRQFNLDHPFRPYFSKIDFNNLSEISLVSPSGLIHWDFPTEILYAFRMSPKRARNSTIRDVCRPISYFHSTCGARGTMANIIKNRFHQGFEVRAYRIQERSKMICPIDL